MSGKNVPEHDTELQTITKRVTNDTNSVHWAKCMFPGPSFMCKYYFTELQIRLYKSPVAFLVTLYTARGTIPCINRIAA